MASVSDASCNKDLIAIIRGGEDLTFVFSHIYSISTTLGVTASSNPIPAGVNNVDHINRNNDVLRINGITGCKACFLGQTTSLLDVITTIKKSMYEEAFDESYFFRVDTNHGSYQNMILKDARIEHKDTELNFLNVSLDFEAANIAGSIDNPGLVLGGVTFG